MELLVVQYCQEDADFNKKKIIKIGQKCQSCEVSKFPKFCQKFYPIFRVLLFVGVKIMGEKKKVFKQKILGGKNFLGGFFFFRKYLWGSFSYFTVCTHINFICTRSNSEVVI